MRDRMLIGDRIGLFTVSEVKKGGRIVAACKCGREISMSPTRIRMRRGCHRDCSLFPIAKGGRKAADLKGMVFGLLTAIVGTGESRRDGGPVWLCRCLCGNEVLKTAGLLCRNQRRGHVSSCGCRRKEQLVELHQSTPPKLRLYQLATLNSQYSVHVASARGRGFVPLDRSQWETIVLMPCSYCGRREQRISARAMKNGREGDAVEMVGVDRVDSSIGYVGNSAPCCTKCNRAKGAMGGDEFREWVQHVARFMESRGPVRPVDVMEDDDTGRSAYPWLRGTRAMDSAQRAPDRPVSVAPEHAVARSGAAAAELGAARS